MSGLLQTVPGASVYVADHAQLAELVPACDALITDTPYSEKTHGGHNAALCEDMRRAISYGFWTPAEVGAFVDLWHPRTRGWLVTVTDHILAPAWTAALEAAGRYVFAPLPYVAPGSRVRLLGDGPPCWTNQIVVARPKSAEWSDWATQERREKEGRAPLPGAYILPPGMSVDLPVVGGKPPWLMQQLVEGYSSPGALVVDPCCGAGTTAIGALRSGRRAIVGDLHRPHADLAALWIQHPYRPAPSMEQEERKGQLPLLGVRP